MFPSPLLTVRTSPLGAMARPSGPFRWLPEVTTDPVPALLPRNTASGMAVIRFFTVSATYRVPCGLRPTPVGPITRAAGSVFSANPEPMVVTPVHRGGWLPDNVA